ncbi:MAG: helix-turn-helix domain-containing protein [Aquihabitans sp.]
MTKTTPLGRRFGARVRERRAELGLTQVAVAQRAGVHWTFIGQVERGEREPRLGSLLLLAKGLRWTTSQLVDGIDLPDNPDAKQPDRPRQ